MSYATAKTIAANEIPIIDIGPLVAGNEAAYGAVAQSMRAAAESIGFFYIKNHGVPASAIQRAQAEAKKFFALPLAEKLAVSVSDRHRGFIRIGEAKMYETAKV